MNFRLVDCGKEWKKGIDYYVLGFCFDDAFVNNEYLAQHMQHWKEKDQWFNHEDATTNRKEIWHGSRFIELSWDSTKETSLPSLLPTVVRHVFFLLSLYRCMSLELEIFSQ